jgi:hypothetical protein
MSGTGGDPGYSPNGIAPEEAILLGLPLFLCISRKFVLASRIRQFSDLLWHPLFLEGASLFRENY